MNSRRTTITLTPEMLDVAHVIMRTRRFSGFSDLIQTLIREEYERRVATGTITPLPTEPGPGQALSRKIPPHRS